MKAVDVLGFAGSMACGVDQAGFDVIAKREPDEFKGFGVASMTYNMPWVEAQVSAPGAWDLPAERDVDLVFGCPPCSGFSNLSQVNTVVHGSTYGVESDINKCMGWLIDYAARVKPRVVILESVGPAFKVGQEFMEGLWERLRARSGIDYALTHVNMNAALVGGDVIRPRYFLVAHQDPFGVGLEFVEPRPMIDVIRDLPLEDDPDTDWGHLVFRTRATERVNALAEWFEELGRPWKPGTRIPDNVEGLTPPDFMRHTTPRQTKRGERWDDYDPYVDTTWYANDPFATTRWRGEKPFGVVVAATLERAVHPVYPRTFTFREAARFMSIPDTWSLRWLVEQRRSSELGKAVPTASAKWIAHWARMSIEGTPGEYAGRETANRDVRVITVNSRKAVDDILDGNELDGWWSETSDPSPETWLVKRNARPREWYQREDPLGWFAEKPRRPDPRPGLARTPRRAEKAVPAAPARREGISRVSAETFQALLDEIGLSRAQAAERLGVSQSRIAELSTGRRPGSLLNEARWDEVQTILRG